MTEYYSFECTLCPQDSNEDSTEEKERKYLTRLMIMEKNRYLGNTVKGKKCYGTTFVNNYKHSKAPTVNCSMTVTVDSL